MLDKEERPGQRNVWQNQNKRGTEGHRMGGRRKARTRGRLASRATAATCWPHRRPGVQQALLQECGNQAPSHGPVPNCAMTPKSHLMVYLGLCPSICRTKASGCTKALFLPKKSLGHHTQRIPPPQRRPLSTWKCQFLLRGQGSVFHRRCPDYQMWDDSLEFCKIPESQIKHV